MPKVLDPNESYTFGKYFGLPYSPEDILADLGCTIERSDRENLPYTQCKLDWLPELAQSMQCRGRSKDDAVLNMGDAIAHKFYSSRSID